MGIGVTTEEITVVFFFAPTETRDGREGLVGIALLPACTCVQMRLEMIGPIRPPMVLDLPLTNGGVDAERVAVQGLESVGREIEVTPTHRVFP